jgi:hypothetical protein
MKAPDETGKQGEAAGTPVDASSLLHNRWALLACLFFATGALGIPLLWMGRAFSVPVKIVLTVVVILYTAALCWLFWLVMLWSYQRLVDAL